MSQDYVQAHELFPEPVLRAEDIKQRQILRQQPRDNSSTYTITGGGQGPIRFQLPQEYYVNLAQLVLKLNVAVTGGTTPSVCDGIWSVINRIRVVIGSDEVINEQAYNLNYSIAYQCNAACGGNQPAATSGNTAGVWAPWMGVGVIADRQTWAAGRDYMFRPFDGIAPDKLLPLKYMAPVYIDFYPEAPASCIESATAVTNYIVSSPVLIFNAVTPSDMYDNEMRLRVDEGRLTYLFTRHHYYSQPCTSATNQLQVADTSKSATKIFMVQRNSTTLSAQATLDKLNRWYFNTPTYIQFKKDSNVFPPEGMVIGANAIEAFMHTIMAAKDHDDVDFLKELLSDNTSLSYYNYVTTSGAVTSKFVVGFQFDKSKAEGAIVSGLDLSKNGNGLLVYITQAATANMLCEFFVHVDCMVTIRPNGSVEVVY